jgi:DNA-binding MarR family transcriptional regulator
MQLPKNTNRTAVLFTEVGMLIKSRMQRSIALPFSQCQALWFVGEHKSPSMQDVAKHFKIRAPSATFLIEELVKVGMLERKANAKDRRMVELRLTPKGKKTCKVLAEKRGKILTTIFGSLGESDRKQLNSILEKIIKHA